MMKNLTLRNIASACGGEYVGAESAHDLCVEGITQTAARFRKEDFL